MTISHYASLLARYGSKLIQRKLNAAGSVPPRSVVKERLLPFATIGLVDRIHPTSIHLGKSARSAIKDWKADWWKWTRVEKWMAISLAILVATLVPALLLSTQR